MLTKLSPGNLTRTASTLMREWEASLLEPGEMGRRQGGLGEDEEREGGEGGNVH